MKILLKVLKSVFVALMLFWPIGWFMLFIMYCRQVKREEQTKEARLNKIANDLSEMRKCGGLAVSKS
jgi:preprotein translocase subunit YajC